MASNDVRRGSISQAMTRYFSHPLAAGRGATAAIAVPFAVTAEFVDWNAQQGRLIVILDAGVVGVVFPGESVPPRCQVISSPAGGSHMRQQPQSPPYSQRAVIPDI
jgi:hypothetical protein